MSLKPFWIKHKFWLTSHSMSISPPSDGSRVIAGLNSQHNGQGHSLRDHLCFLVPILVTYLALSFFKIGSQSLWVDEVLSLRYIDADQIDSALWRGPRPLYFALLHLWAQLGTSEAVLRTLSVLIGGMSVLLTFCIGLRCFGVRVARIGTILFATSPFLIWYSQEVRYITLLIAASVFSMYAFQEALRTDRVKWWMGYSCSLIVAIGAFVTNVFVMAAQIGYVTFSRPHRRVLRNALISQLLVLGLFIWWANGFEHRGLGGYLKRFSHEVTLTSQELSSLGRAEGLSTGGKRAFEVAAVPYTLFALSTGFSIGPSVRELQIGRSASALKPYALLVAGLGILFGGLFFLGLFALWKEADKGLFFTLWLVVPVVGVCAISAMTAMAYNVRYVAMVLPAYALILAAGMGRLASGWVQILLLAAVLLVNGFSLGNYHFNPRYAREDARAAALYLESVVGPHDPIVVVGNATALGYYYKGNRALESWSGIDQDGELAGVNGSAQLRGNCGRVWLVEIRPWEREPKGRAKAMLGEAHDLVGSESFPGVDIYAYRKKSDLACMPFAS